MYTGIHSSASYFPLFQQVSSSQSQNKNEPNPKSLVKLKWEINNFNFSPTNQPSTEKTTTIIQTIIKRHFGELWKLKRGFYTKIIVVKIDIWEEKNQILIPNVWPIGLVQAVSMTSKMNALKIYIFLFNFKVGRNIGR